MTKLIEKFLNKAIEKGDSISVSQGLDYDPTEIACEKGTVFEMDDTFLFIEEHYFLWKDDKDHEKGQDEHILFHLIRIADIVYIGNA